MLQRWIAAVAMLAFASGCFGYTRSAKRWSYAGNILLMLGGGAAIAGDVLANDEPCTGNACPMYTTPVSGGIVAGALLATVGLAGIVLAATRPIVKTPSR